MNLPMSAQRDRGVAWRPLLVCPDPRIREEAEGALSACGTTEVVALATYPAPGMALRMATDRRANFALIDISTDAARAMETVAELGSSVPMVALHVSQPDATLILRLLRYGIREFIAPPIEPAQLAEILSRVAPQDAGSGARQPGNVTLVVPGKPGSGASTFAAQLAFEVRNEGVAPVLLADTDAQGEAIAFLLKIQPSYRLSDALESWSRLDAELWDRFVSKTQGIDVLAAPDPGSPVRLDAAGAAGVAEFFRQSYPLSVIDCGGWSAGPTDAFALAADQIYLVTTPDLPALHQTRRTAEWLERTGVDRQKMRLIVNQRFPNLGLPRQDVEAALMMPVAAVLAPDPQELHRAVLEGRPANSKSAYARSVRLLLAQNGTRITAPPPQASSSGLRSWFSSLHR